MHTKVKHVYFASSSLLQQFIVEMCMDSGLCPPVEETITVAEIESACAHLMCVHRVSAETGDCCCVHNVCCCKHISHVFVVCQLRPETVVVSTSAMCLLCVN